MPVRPIEEKIPPRSVRNESAGLYGTGDRVPRPGRSGTRPADALLHRAGGPADVNSPPTWCAGIPKARSSTGSTSIYAAEPRSWVLTDTFAVAGFEDLEIESFTTHKVHPLDWHADVLIGRCIKRR